MVKSYFTVLGVTSNASPNEIRAAYRQLSKEFHPDHFKGGSAPFREIQEAYSVLGNTQRRREYEQSIGNLPVRRQIRKMIYPEPEPLVPERGPIDIGEISPVGSFQTSRPSFDQIFEWCSTHAWRYNLPFFKIATSSQTPMMAAAKKPMIPIREMP